jgi:hypothetical protein
VSTLIGPTRYFRSASVEVADLITWTETEPGVWTGAIDLDFAGSIRLMDGRWVSSDWNGDEVVSTRSLKAAKESLEPRRRMLQRDLDERRAARVQWLVAGGAAAASALAFALVAQGVLFGA